MFRKIFCMDLKRCFCSRRFIAIVIGATLLLLGTAGNYIIPYLMILTPEEKQTAVGAIDFLQYAMGFDVFKVVIVLLLSALYTSSFCQDENNHYLRMILSRADVATYTRSKFLTNICAIVIGATVVCSLFSIVVVALGYPIVSKGAQGGLLGAIYYRGLLEKYPILYIGLTGLQFGIVTAACSSVGMVFSVYQPNGFASIGISGILFFILLSFSVTVLNGTPVDILNLVSMNSVLPTGNDANPWMMFAWGMLYPLVVIVFCCVKFEHRMEWRAKNGII